MLLSKLRKQILHTYTCSFLVMSSDSLPWDPPAPQLWPQSLGHLPKHSLSDSGHPLGHMTVPPYLLFPRLNTFGGVSLGTMCQGFKIPEKMEPRTGLRLSCPVRLVGAATPHYGPWASVLACTSVCSMVALPLGCWSLSPGPSLSQTQQREEEGGHQICQIKRKSLHMCLPEARPLSTRAQGPQAAPEGSQLIQKHPSMSAFSSRPSGWKGS